MTIYRGTREFARQAVPLKTRKCPLDNAIGLLYTHS